MTDQHDLGGIELLIDLAQTNDQVRSMLVRGAKSGDFLAGSGLDRSTRIKARDSALKEAAKLLAPGKRGVFAIATLLSDEIKNFVSRKWPYVYGINDQLTPVQKAIHKAFLTGVTVPSSAHQIYLLLKLEENNSNDFLH